MFYVWQVALKDLINIGVGGPLSCRNLRISRVFEPCVFWGLLRIRWSSKNVEKVMGNYDFCSDVYGVWPGSDKRSQRLGSVGEARRPYQ